MEIDPLSPRKYSATLHVDNPNETLEERLEIEKSFQKRVDEARRRFRRNVMPSFPQETTEPHTPS